MLRWFFAKGNETLKSSISASAKFVFFLHTHKTHRRERERERDKQQPTNAGEEEAGRKREEDEHDNDHYDDDKESTTRRKEKDASDELPPEKIAQEETGDTRQVRAVERNAREIGEGVGEEEEEGESERAEVYAEDETIKRKYSSAARVSIENGCVCVY